MVALRSVFGLGSRRFRALTFCWVLLLVAAVLVACGQLGAGGEDGETSAAAEVEDDSQDKGGEKKKGQGDDEEEEPDKAIPIEVAALGRGGIEEVLRFSTNLEAESEVQVSNALGRDPFISQQAFGSVNAGAWFSLA